MNTNRLLSRAILGIALSLPLVFSETSISLAQVSSLPASRNQITGIRLVPSGSRMKLEIDTAGGSRPQVFFTQQGNAWVGDITNAELRNAQGTRQEKPLPGVKLLEATQLDKSSVRVQIVGESNAPQGLLAERTSSRLVFDFQSLEPSAVVASQPTTPTAVSPIPLAKPSTQSPVSQSPSAPTVATTSLPASPATAKPSDVPAPKPTLLSLPPRTPSQPAVPSALAPATPISPLPLAKAPDAATTKPALLTPPAPGSQSPIALTPPTTPQVAQASPARPVTTSPAPSLAARAVAPPSGDIATSDLVIPLNTIDLGSTRTISLTLRNAPVGDVLSLLIRRAGLNIVLNDVPAASEADGVVSLDVKDSPLQETFDFILRLKNLQAIRKDQTVFIGRTLPGIDQQIVRNYRINQSTPDELVAFLQSLAVEGGPLVGAQFITDARTNSLTAIATTTQQSVIAAQIAQLDVREWQVLVDVRVLEVDQGSNTPQNAFELGFQSGNFTYTTPGLEPNSNGVLFSSAVNLPEQYLARLNRSQTGNSKILSNPRIVCAQGEDCKIDIGTSVVTNVESSTDPATGVTTQTLVFETAGVILELEGTRVDGNGFISFDNFTPSVNSPGTPNVIGNTTINQLNKKSVELGKVRFRDGETYVLSGLIQETDIVNVNKIPLLGDIPLLGQLFRTETNQKQRTETVFLITPYILRDGLVDGVPISRTMPTTSTASAVTQP
ncbi:MAG: hypothetical protein OHK0012_22910 [Synechococcales cyanobacterium]